MTDPFAPMPVVPAPQPLPAQAPAGSGRSRILAPIIWELVLLFAAAIAVAVVFLSTPRPPVSIFLAGLTSIGLIGVAVALSLRTATVNLAAGSLAVLAGTIGVWLTDEGTALVIAMSIGVVVAAAVGLILGLLAAALSVPAWAVTLGGATVIQAAIIGLWGNDMRLLRDDATFQSGVWFALFVLLTLGGAALWFIPGIRTTLSATRDVAPAGRWGGMRSGLGAIIGLAGSGFVAGLAGVAYTLNTRVTLLSIDQNLTLVGLAVALLGGISVFGRRGGVAGVLLATILLGSVQEIMNLNRAPSWVVIATTGVAVLIGLAASRLIESLTQPRENTVL